MLSLRSHYITKKPRQPTRIMTETGRFVVPTIEMKGITRCKLTITTESVVCKKFLGQIVSYLASPIGL